MAGKPRKPRNKIHTDKATHPSHTCYKDHGCRCAECTAMVKAYQAEYRRRTSPLDDVTLQKLRRQVGLPPE